MLPKRNMDGDQTLAHCLVSLCTGATSGETTAISLPDALLRPRGSQGGNRSEECLLARSDVGLVAADPKIPEIARVAVALLPARWKLGIARVQGSILCCAGRRGRSAAVPHKTLRTYMVDASSRSDG